jgi:hypothetical protein
MRLSSETIIAQEPHRVQGVREAAVRNVRRDPRLTIGARLLYAELNDLAGPRGETEKMNQATLARRLCVGVHSVLDWTKELEGEYIRRQRERHGCVYRLACLDGAQ